jgi:uncharacterized protein YegL
MKKRTDITIILDRSGSMDSIKEATIEGFNSFLKKQKSGDFETNVTLVQFDDEYQMVYEGQNSTNVKYLNNKSYVPRGMTALLDAIGTTITLAKKRIKAIEKLDRPENVITAIITDGEENASTKYTRESILKMIRKREGKNNWNFVFLAANQDAIAEGSKFGIRKERALTFKATGNGMKNAFHSLSNLSYDLNADSICNFKFSKEDREKQQEDLIGN